MKETCKVRTYVITTERNGKIEVCGPTYSTREDAERNAASNAMNMRGVSFEVAQLTIDINNLTKQGPVDWFYVAGNRTDKHGLKGRLRGAQGHRQFWVR